MDTIMVTAPTRNPVSPPKATPEMMTSASTGVNWGSIKKADRPATPMAQSTERVTSSLAFGFLLSKTKKNGIMHSISTSIAVTI